MPDEIIVLSEPPAYTAIPQTYFVSPMIYSVQLVGGTIVTAPDHFPGEESLFQPPQSGADVSDSVDNIVAALRKFQEEMLRLQIGFAPTQVEELMRVARQIAIEAERRRAEDVGEWARRLAESISDLND
jgi:hypothetical protein